MPSVSGTTVSRVLTDLASTAEGHVKRLAGIVEEQHDDVRRLVGATAQEPTMIETDEHLKPALTVGDRVRFEPYRRAMTVRAVTTGGRFAILTSPFAAQRTVTYTVIDFVRGVRGCDDHYGLGYETDEQVAAALEAFQATEDDLRGQRAREAQARGETSWPYVFAAEVSHRHFVPLDIVTVLRAAPTDQGGNRG